MTTTNLKLYAILMIALAGGLLSLLSIEQASGQMMNPNTMMNPDMMFNRNGVNPMFNQTQNITGSIKLAPTLFKAISPVIKVSLSDAIKSAETQLGNNSRVVAANLGHENGYLTYTVCAMDEEMNLHRVIIDAGNGKVLLTTVLPMQKFMLNHMMGPMMGSNMMGFMMNPGFIGPMMR
ncbi:MAG TPA: PepSY domain-containing protein [Nitrososphaeraceae archaeon]|nr:PepSY domain-containing protein [Nitrososphaeraceae archaeon]